MPLELLSYRPYDHVYHLNEGLVADARRAAESVELLDSDATDEYRNRYSQATAREKPSVDVGTTPSETGTRRPKWRRWEPRPHSTGSNCWTRYLSVRGVVNFDRPYDGQSIRESLDDGVQAETFDVTLENVCRVGSAIVEELRDD